MRKRIASTLLALCMVLAMLPGTARAAKTSGSCGDGVTWSYSAGTLTIQGAGRMLDYSFCQELPWYDYIGQIHTIEIRNGVTAIGTYAFSRCSNLTSVTIPDSVTAIGEYAFLYCGSLTDVTIPFGVTSIADATFTNCSSLTSVTIPGSVLRIGASAFSSCISLTDVTIPDSVTSIRTSAFSGCRSLTGVTIPSGVSGIESYTFRGCISLTRAAIPDSVTSIGEFAFGDCGNLADVYYAGSETNWATIDVDRGNEHLTNAAIHYDSAAPDTPPVKPDVPSSIAEAVLSPQKLTVDGRSVDCEKYNIGGSNYFKLRDLALLLSGTGSRFGVRFDQAASMVSVTTGAAYTPNGTELAPGADHSGIVRISSQTILIDGAAHPGLTAYNIGGSNFFQLRELGDVLGFEVDYDATTDTAIVRSVGEAPSDPVDQANDPVNTDEQTPSPPAEPILANGKTITDENIREILYGLKSEYPEGLPWTDENSYFSTVLWMTGTGCEGFALICSDAVFGDLPVSREHSVFADVKVGDLLRINNGTHTVVVLEKKENSVIVAEGNYNSQIHWGREINRQSLEEGDFIVRSRYPMDQKP